MYHKPLLESDKLEKFLEMLLKFREEDDDPNTEELVKNLCKDY